MLKFIVLIVICFFSTFEIRAQLCGRYTTVFSINTTEGKPINNAVIELVPLKENETRFKTFVRDESDLSKFSITFNEGHEISGKYKIIISAEGFKNYEFETGFPHCKTRNFVLKLEKSDSETKSELEEIREINFRAVDENKKGIEKVETTVIWEKGKDLEKTSNEYGQTDFEVFNNKIIKIRFKKNGYKTKEIEIDLSKDNFIYMDVKLEKVE